MLNNVIYFETRVKEYVNSMMIPGKKYSFFLDNGEPYDPFTKKMTIRKETEKMVVINEYSDDYGNYNVIVKKYASKDALQKVHGFCTDHNGKMANICSCSTSVKLNPRCMARAKNPDSICHCCFAAQMLKDYGDNMENKVARNTERYTTRILAMYELPLIDPEMFPFFRFESFGDISNTIQVINYIQLARMNSRINFAWWTKNPDIIDAALKEYGETIPENVNIIYSSPKKNIQADAVTLKAKYPFITAIFTVYTAAYAIHHNVDINCGARDCYNCATGCYRIHDRNNIVIVNEIEKSEQKAYYAALAA